jgi:transposase
LTGIYFHFNKQYIQENLCINKNLNGLPEVSCKGKCHLRKMIELGADGAFTDNTENENNKGPKLQQSAEEAIMELHRKNCLREAAEIAELSVSAVADLIKKYKEEGLNCIQHHKGNGRPLVFDESERQIIKELFYSPIPEHRKAWTLRLLAKTAVDRGLLMHISHTSVANILVSMGIYIEEAHACAS